jgi:hypothetical protein
VIATLVVVVLGVVASIMWLRIVLTGLGGLWTTYARPSLDRVLDAGSLRLLFVVEGTADTRHTNAPPYAPRPHR